MSKISFHTTGDRYDVFSNVSPDLPITCNLGDGQYRSFTSTEAVFQGLKHVSPGRAANHSQFSAISAISAMSPGAGQQRAGGYHPLWDDKQLLPSSITTHPIAHLNGDQLTIKERLMYESIRMKATQHPEVLKELFNTGGASLEENTSLLTGNDSRGKPVDDRFWGNGRGDVGATTSGRNALGRLWELLRDDLQKELQQSGQIAVRTGLSEDLYRGLQLDHVALPGQATPVQYVRGSDIDSSRVITQANLNAIPSGLNISRDIADPSRNLNRGRYHTQTSRGAPLFQSQPQKTQVSNFSNPNSAHSRALEGFKKLSVNATSFDIAPDTAKPGQNVLKLRFTDPASAAAFQNAANQPKYNAHIGAPRGNTIIIAMDKAQNLLTTLGYGKHGQSNPHYITTSLVYEDRLGRQPQQAFQQQPQQTQVSNFSNPNSAHSRALSGFKTLSSNATSFDIAPDTAKPGQNVLKLRFTDPASATAFQNAANQP